jgi:hypothetical protein
LRDSELLEPGGKLKTVGACVDLLHHIQNGAVDVDDECPPFGIRPTLVHHSVRGGDLFVGIAQNGIVEAEGFGETPVGGGGITARSKEGDVVLVEAGSFGCRKIDLFSTLELDNERFGTSAGTQRVALASSTTGEGFWEPCQDDDLFAAEVGKAIRRVVTSGKLEGGCLIPDRQTA